MLYKMKWKFCRVKENDYYFGEIQNPSFAHGIGIYFEDLKSYFYGSWDNGNLVKVFAKEGSYQPQGDRPVIQAEILYGKYLVFTEAYDMNLDNHKNDLFHEFGISELQDFSVRVIKISDLKGIFKVLKSIHYMFRYKKAAFAILTKFMLVNFHSEQLEFQLVTNKIMDPWSTATKLESYEDKINACIALSDYLNHIHEQNICHDDITPNSICATLNQKREIIFSFCDFSRARSFNNEESKNGHKVKSLLSRSKEYRAYETYTKNIYDCKKSDIYSLNLSIFAIILGDKSISEIRSENAVKDLIYRFQNNQMFAERIKPDFINKCLTSKPNERQKFSNKQLTTDL